MAEFNEENTRKLAEKIVDSMDLGTLVEFAVEQIEKNYCDDDSYDSFNYDWDLYFGED